MSGSQNSKEPGDAHKYRAFRPEKMRSTVSKQREELHSSQRDNFCLRTILYDLQLPRIEILGSFFGVL